MSKMLDSTKGIGMVQKKILLLLLNSNKGTGVATKRTICEVHRNMYDIIVLEILESNPKLAEKLSNLLEEAFVMGIKMAKKLKEYKYDIGEDLDFNEKEPARLLRERRMELLDKIKKGGEKSD